MHCEKLFLNFILQVVTELEGRVLAASVPVSARWLEFDVGGMFFGRISFTIFDYLFILSLADCGLLSISVFINIFKWKVVFSLDHSSKIF